MFWNGLLCSCYICFINSYSSCQRHCFARHPQVIHSITHGYILNLHVNSNTEIYQKTAKLCICQLKGSCQQPTIRTVNVKAFFLSFKDNRDVWDRFQTAHREILLGYSHTTVTSSPFGSEIVNRLECNWKKKYIFLIYFTANTIILRQLQQVSQ